MEKRKVKITQPGHVIRYADNEQRAIFGSDFKNINHAIETAESMGFEVLGHGRCPDCGGDYVGDGVTSVRHCEYAPEEDYEHHAPDEGPVNCNVCHLGD